MSRLLKPCSAATAISRSTPPIDHRRARLCRPAVSMSDRATLATFRCPLAEEALGPEDQDQDQEGEDDRLGPVAPRGVPAQPLVERLDEADQHRAEDGARQVADPAEHGRGERDQAELEALIEADRPGV